jgi:thiamine pyrophosphate-dependent acetolactate synthase large subunit-like protein
VTDSRELPDAIREAQASGRPAVIDVLIDHGPNPDDIRASERGSTET